MIRIGGPRPDWWPDWEGEPLAIVAAGPSAPLAPLATLAGAGVRILAVNNSWQLHPAADALYGCDFKWWDMNAGVPAFRGLKLSQDQRAVDKYREVKRVWLDQPAEHRFLLEEAGHIGSGGNGGFQALNLGAQFGSNPIGLFGFDLGGDHWHGQHPPPLSDPNRNGGSIFAAWTKHFDKGLPALADRGITVINFAPGSRISAIEKRDPAGAVELLAGRKGRNDGDKRRREDGVVPFHGAVQLDAAGIEPDGRAPARHP